MNNLKSYFNCISTNFIYICLLLIKWPKKIIAKFITFMTRNQFIVDSRYLDNVSSYYTPFRHSLSIFASDENGVNVQMNDKQLELVKNIAINMELAKKNDNQITIDDIIKFCNLSPNVHTIYSQSFPWKNDDSFTITRKNNLKLDLKLD